jgi:hypothetical protein
LSFTKRSRQTRARTARRVNDQVAECRGEWRATPVPKTHDRLARDAHVRSPGPERHRRAHSVARKWTERRVAQLTFCCFCSFKERGPSRPGGGLCKRESCGTELPAARLTPANPRGSNSVSLLPHTINALRLRSDAASSGRSTFHQKEVSAVIPLVLYASRIRSYF